MGIRDDSKCIKCGTAEGTLLHLLWDYNEIKDLWFGITKQAMNHTNIVIPLTPQSCILGDLHNFSRVSSKNKNIFLSLCMVTKK